MEMTRILDESPGTPGRRQHMPRTIRSIRTPASWARMSGEEIEQRGEVLAERVAAREEPQIAVDAARPHVIVPGGEMTVAPQSVGLLADHEARLAVGLEAGSAVDDVSAHLLERDRKSVV